MYKQTVAVTELEFPEMGDEEIAQIKNQMEQGAGNGEEFCLNEEQAPKWKEAVQGLSQSMGGSCTDTSREETDTTLKVAMQCTGAPQGDIAVALDASSSDAGMTGDVKFDIDNKQFDQQAKISFSYGAERVGDCAG